MNSNKIKIVVLETGHASESYLAGGDKVLEEMVKYLPSQYEFNIIVPKIGVKHWQEAHLDVKFYVLPSNPFDNNTRPVHVFLAYCVRIWQSFFKFKDFMPLHIIYSSTHVLPDIIPAYLFKKFHSDITWIVKIHHLVPHPSIRSGNRFVNIVSYAMQKITLLCLKNDCDMIFANSPTLLTELSKLGLPRKKIRVLGNGIEFRKITKIPIDKTIPLWHGVYVGRLHPAKGVLDTVDIWQHVVKKVPNAKLAIIGEGQDQIKKSLENKIKKAHLTKHIKILGYVSNNELFSILKRAKIFLFTDHEAGWGLAVAEAMACGLPVVGYKLQIFEDIYKQGFITVEKYNRVSFAEKALLLLTNKNLWNTMSKRAKKQAELLSWEKTSNIFQTYLKDLSYESLPKN